MRLLKQGHATLYNPQLLSIGDLNFEQQYPERWTVRMLLSIAIVVTVVGGHGS